MRRFRTIRNVAAGVTDAGSGCALRRSGQVSAGSMRGLSKQVWSAGDRCVRDPSPPASEPRESGRDVRRPMPGIRVRARVRIGAVVAVLGVLWFVAPAALAGGADKYDIPDLKALERAFESVADQVRPSVVAVRTYYERPTSKRKGAPKIRSVAENHGTGLLLTSDGYILTNHHVVRGVDSVRVILHNGREYEAQIVQGDRRSDLAVLKIDAEHLKAVKLGRAESLHVGQWAIVVGNPFGLAKLTGKSALTVGTVSAIGRDMTPWLARSDQYYGNLIQTSAPINPGNSGGPMFNVDGEVVGVVTAIQTESGVSEGVGFAIPIDRYTRRIIDTLKSGRPVSYGFLGIRFGSINARYLRALGVPPTVRGARIGYVVPDRPADRAHLQVDDLIIEFDGEHIDDADELLRLVGFTPSGTHADVKYIRGGKTLTTSVVLIDRKEGLASAKTRSSPTMTRPDPTATPDKP